MGSCSLAAPELRRVCLRPRAWVWCDTCIIVKSFYAKKSFYKVTAAGKVPILGNPPSKVQKYPLRP